MKYEIINSKLVKPKSSGNKFMVSLTIFLALLTYDGAIRKWLLPASEQLTFVIKDFFLFFSIIYLIKYLSSEERRDVFYGISLPYFFYCLLNFLSGNAPNLFIGFWGLKTYFLYYGVSIIIYKLCSNINDFNILLEKIYPYLVFPPSILGLLQVALPSDNILNIQIRSDSDALAFFGDGLVRVSGTFSYLGGMAAFLSTMFGLGFYLILQRRTEKKFLISFFLLTLTLPVAGSRSVLAFSGYTFFSMLVLFAIFRIISTIMLVRILFVGLFGVALSLEFSPDTWMAIFERTRSLNEAGESQGRIVTAFTSAFHMFSIGGYFGFGPGAANSGAVALSLDQIPFSWFPVGTGFEEEQGRIVLELGFIGWLLSFLWRLMLFFESIHYCNKIFSTEKRIAGAYCGVYFLYSIYTGFGYYYGTYGLIGFFITLSMLLVLRKSSMQENMYQEGHRTLSLP